MVYQAYFPVTKTSLTNVSFSLLAPKEYFKDVLFQWKGLKLSSLFWLEISICPSLHHGTMSEFNTEPINLTFSFGTKRVRAKTGSSDPSAICWGSLTSWLPDGSRSNHDWYCSWAHVTCLEMFLRQSGTAFCFSEMTLARETHVFFSLTKYASAVYTPPDPAPVCPATAPAQLELSDNHSTNMVQSIKLCIALHQVRDANWLKLCLTRILR